MVSQDLSLSCIVTNFIEFAQCFFHWEIIILCLNIQVQYISFYIHSTYIFTQSWSTLDKENKDSCDLKETFVFFLNLFKSLPILR